ncbi:rolling circle replication-associated protein [Candidatus Clostridium helianthi]|uniref:Replication-associated protein ORF2/G2P domain-containing protein n=1 Tax=Candidatus Clostridium helianthi TaxID=3381660 RepID=A0ABW8S172_9CLOT
MPYVRKETVAGKTVEVEKYYTYKFKAKGVKRGEVRKSTSEEQEKINLKHAEKKLRIKINANYEEGDFHMISDYRKNERPLDRKEMREDADEFLRKLRKEYKKQGKELKYIHVMEIGSKGAMHHHWIINCIDTKILQKCWPKGRIKVFPLDETGQYGELAAYLIKQTSKTKELQSKKWSCSKNLITPEPDIEIISDREWFRNVPQPKKGYYIDKNSIQKGISEFTGYGYLRYTMIKISGIEVKKE